MADKHSLLREDVRIYNPLIHGSTLNATTLNAAISAIGVDNWTLILTPGTWTIGANVSIPSNITFWVMAGAVADVQSSFTLTVSGPLRYEQTGWKTGSGTLSITSVFPLFVDASGPTAGAIPYFEADGDIVDKQTHFNWRNASNTLRIGTENYPSAGDPALIAAKDSTAISIGAVSSSMVALWIQATTAATNMSVGHISGTSGKALLYFGDTDNVERVWCGYDNSAERMILGTADDPDLKIARSFRAFAIGRGGTPAQTSLFLSGSGQTSDVTQWDFQTTLSTGGSYRGMQWAPAVQLQADQGNYQAARFQALIFDDATARTVTDIYGLYVADAAKSTGITVTNAYSLYLERPTIGGSKNVPVYIEFATQHLQLVNTSTAGTTEQAALQVTHGTQTGYIRIYASA